MSQPISPNRIQKRFQTLKAQNRAGLVTFITAGDPDFETSLDILKGLPAAGADIIELGMPFSDPMADGPVIEAAGLRALKAGQTMRHTLDMVRQFRAGNDETPIVLMGYFNPIHAYGVEAFLKDASLAGVDGLIIVDLPPEEDQELAIPAQGSGIDFIRLATPTTREGRMDAVLQNTSGFIYYVSVTGVTGGATATADHLDDAIAQLKANTDLPIAVGFGIRTPEQAAKVAKRADAAVVGTAIIEVVQKHLNDEGHASPSLIPAVHDYVHALAQGVHNARVDA